MMEIELECGSQSLGGVIIIIGEMDSQPARAWVNKSTVHEAMNTDKW